MKIKNLIIINCFGANYLHQELQKNDYVPNKQKIDFISDLLSKLLLEIVKQIDVPTKFMLKMMNNIFCKIYLE